VPPLQVFDDRGRTLCAALTCRCIALNKPLDSGFLSSQRLFLLLVFHNPKPSIPCLFLFIQKDSTSLIILLIYVDDILITGNNIESIKAVKQFLHTRFHIKDLGDLKFFLGIKTAHSKKGIYISKKVN